ncbi:hypothetical protein EFR84_06160 [Rhizobium chutanense]|uniref:Uncharacterized protein n=1 Tax=Rhizobium chutanense TaxID=2035448 RepID=A0A432P6M6_9HYPH|nr:hypothetical protein EFR84_06160 [Rhizobium chutanense]
MRSKVLNDVAALDQALRADLRAGCVVHRHGKILRQHYLQCLPCHPFHALRNREIAEVIERYQALFADIAKTGRDYVD